jgi:hypothetical protein
MLARRVNAVAVDEVLAIASVLPSQDRDLLGKVDRRDILV